MSGSYYLKDPVLHPNDGRFEGMGKFPRQATASVVIEDVAKQVVDTGHQIAQGRKSYEAAKPALEAAKHAADALRKERQALLDMQPAAASPQEQGFIATTLNVLTGRFFRDAETRYRNTMTPIALLEDINGRMETLNKQSKTLEPIVSGFEALTVAHDAHSKTLKKIVGLLPTYTEVAIARLEFYAADRPRDKEALDLIKAAHMEAEREKKLHHAAAAEADVLKGKATVASSHTAPLAPAQAPSPPHRRGHDHDH